MVETVTDTTGTTDGRIEEIKAQLDRILDSRVFVNSHRIRRFLQFVVEECLRGQPHRLKEYLIGIHVFDRTETFDPRVDSIVRVEARRLRAKLDGYYLTEGRDDMVRIVLRKGSYVPAFEDRKNRASEPGAGGSWPQRHSIAITPFAIPTTSGDASGLAEEIKRRLTHVLIKEGNFQVIPLTQRAATASGSAWPDSGTAAPRPDYVVEGSGEIQGERMHLIVQLLNVNDGSYVWSEAAECNVKDLSKVEELARALTRELAAG